MADVTFGVKVTEEMKNELTEVMKNTQLSGKEFMGLLLSAYKIEKSKEDENILGSDIKELQRLLGRVQNLYLNISERAQIYVEDRLKEQDAVYQEAEVAYEKLVETLSERETHLKKVQEEVKRYEKLLKESKENEKDLENKLMDSQKQLKNNQLLYEKYEKEIEDLKERIETYKRLSIEIEERTSENTMLQKRNDDLVSEVWFLKREIEKISEEGKSTLEKCVEKEIQLKNQHALELKNALLEQKLSFSAQIDLLKEEQFKMQQEHVKVMNAYWKQNLTEEKPNC